MENNEIKGKIIGIDLGTTNSCISVVENGLPVIIPTPDGNVMPSVVCLEKNKIVVGMAAKNQAYTNPNTVLSVKTAMGSDKKIELGDKSFAPEQISAFILQKLKKHASEYLGYEINDAVITVPAYFNELQREATRNAGEIAGFNVCQIINEPTSAALIYGLNKKLSENVLVYDLGGGTFDVSLLRVENQNIKVIATSGNNHLGGDDFDYRIMEYCVEKFMKETQIDLSTDKLAIQRLKEAAEKAKIDLSSSLEAHIKQPFIASNDDGPLHMDYKLTRKEFEDLTQNLIGETIDLVKTVLKDAKFSVKKINRILLVGGSTKMPAVFNTIMKVLKKKPIRSINTDEVVALGAAVQGAIFNREIEDVVINDITPLTLSLVTSNGLCFPLIKKNTPIPSESVDVFTTEFPEQMGVDIKVVQGERKLASNNRTIGYFQLAGIKPSLLGSWPKIIVKFLIDENGFLHVTAQDKETSKNQSIIVKDHLGISKQEVQQMIIAAKENFQSDLVKENRIKLKNRCQSIIYEINALLWKLNEAKILDEIKINKREKITNIVRDASQAIADENHQLLKKSCRLLEWSLCFLMKINNQKDKIAQKIDSKQPNIVQNDIGENSATEQLGFSGENTLDDGTSPNSNSKNEENYKSSVSATQSKKIAEQTV